MSREDELLAILNAHGQNFLESFPQSATAKRKRSPSPESEWGGIQSSEDEDDSPNDEASPNDLHRERLSEANITVFSHDPSSSKSTLSKAQMKAFMSSKVSAFRQDVSTTSTLRKAVEEDDEETTHAQNDALLHRLVHTKLLSGSLAPDLNLTPAQRHKALAGRVLELSGNAKLGKGELLVRATERNKASKRVREGLLAKEKQKHAERIQEAKDLGNYHPSLKKLFKSSSTSGGSHRTRARGLRMGVGKFSGGVLKLTREEVNQIHGKNSGKQPLRRQGHKN